MRKADWYFFCGFMGRCDALPRNEAKKKQNNFNKLLNFQLTNSKKLSIMKFKFKVLVILVGDLPLKSI